MGGQALMSTEKLQQDSQSKHKKNKISTKLICMIALFMALVCVATLFFKVPIPLGYAHLGNGIILLGAFIIGNPGAIIIAGIGSAMADLLGGYTEWILPTLMIKSLMGGITAWIIWNGNGKSRITSIRTAVGILTGTVIMVIGYVLAGSILYGSFAMGLAQIPGLIAEDVVGIILFYVLGIALEKTGLIRNIID